MYIFLACAHLITTTNTHEIAYSSGCTFVGQKKTLYYFVGYQLKFNEKSTRDFKLLAD